MNQHVEEIDINLITANPHQPRQDSFDKSELESLASTIESVGIIHPPLVRKDKNGHYELIAGERRYRAALMAGLKRIPVCIKEASDNESSLAAIIENIQRSNLNPIELALALNKVIEKNGYTHEEMSKKVGINRATLSNQLRLLTLPDPIQRALIENILSLGHAKVILSLPSQSQQISLFQMIIRSKLNVRDTEQKARKMLSERKKDTKIPSRNIFLEQISESLQKKMGTRVEFVGNEKKGMIQLHYYSLSDLNRLLNELGYTEE